MMSKTKFHPLILLSLLISAIAMGMYAYDHYIEHNTGYTVTFIILCLFLTVLAICGLVKYREINHTGE